MRDRLPTLVLYANGAKLPAVLLETALQGFLSFNPGRWLPEAWMRRPLIRKLIGQRYEHASYLDDWKDAFCDADCLDVQLCNMTNIVEYRRCRQAIQTYPLVVILHSATGDSMLVLLRTLHWFQRRKGKLLVFVGNEYDLMDEKIRFIRDVEADYVASQLPADAARWLYAECSATKLLLAPHALNPKVYYPAPDAPKVADLGFVGDHYSRIVGDREREDFIRTIEKNAARWGLQVHIRSQRIRREEWAALLRGFIGVVGAESGTYYLERDSKTIKAVRRYLRFHRNASFEEVYERFFAKRVISIPGKAISSRHFEPIGTKTCQILLEGQYNGILRPNEHYISVKKDFSNLEDAIERFKDDTFRQRIVDQAFEYVMAEHTYAHRVASLLRQMRL